MRTVRFVLAMFFALMIGHNAGAQEGDSPIYNPGINREIRLTKLKLISLEMDDLNAANADWNTEMRSYKKLDDIRPYELLQHVRKAQAALKNVEHYLQTFDTIEAKKEAPMPMRDFRCICGVYVFTNNPDQKLCLSCIGKREASKNKVTFLTVRGEKQPLCDNLSEPEEEVPF